MSQEAPNFSPEDQRELAQFLEQEQAKARLQEVVHTMADTCWDKCIFKVNNKTDRSDEACLTNCVERFFDSRVFIVKRLEELRNSGA